MRICISFSPAHLGRVSGFSIISNLIDEKRPHSIVLSFLIQLLVGVNLFSVSVWYILFFIFGIFWSFQFFLNLPFPVAHLLAGYYMTSNTIYIKKSKF